jgi:lysozyme family protein
MTFDEAFGVLLGEEGAYSNDSRDPGGETMWGVTRKVALQEGYTGGMHVLPKDTAKAIYFKRYWQPMRCDSMPDVLKFSLFDAAVNSGVGQAVKWLQRAMDVGDDGVLGPLTLDAAQRGNGLRLAIKFNAERLDFMTSLPTWSAYGKGLGAANRGQPFDARMKYALAVLAFVLVVYLAALWLRLPRDRSARC